MKIREAFLKLFTGKKISGVWRQTVFSSVLPFCLGSLVLWALLNKLAWLPLEEGKYTITDLRTQFCFITLQSQKPKWLLCLLNTMGNSSGDNFLKCFPSGSSTTFKNGGTSHQSMLLKILSHAPKVVWIMCIWSSSSFNQMPSDQRKGVLWVQLKN